MGSLPLELFQPLDPDVFIKESHAVVDFIADYYRGIEQYPVRSQAEPGYLSKLLPDTPPIFSEPIDTILEDIKKDIIPGLTHWQSPNFYAYFQANASTAGFLGEMLCSGFNVVGFSWISSPAATELESIVMDWMAKMMKLPSMFLFSGGQGGGGVLHGSTCEAVVCTLAAARDKALTKIGHDSITKLVVYASDQTHFTVQKASKIIGIPPCNFRVIPTTAYSGYGLTADAVRSVMEEDISQEFTPLYLCATVGTTAIGAVDPLLELGQVAKEFGVWFHVDAAYAGSSAVCPEFRRYFDGVELADSISMNPHKWFLTNMDCCCLWLRSPTELVDSLSTNPETLRNKPSDAREVVDYKDWQIALSRRFRAMKLWLVIRRYGMAGLMEHIRSDVGLAKHFEKLPRFDDDDDDDGLKMNIRLLDAVNSSGRAFMTHAIIGGRFVIRFAIGTTLTEIRHVDATWRLIQGIAKGLLLADHS
ncbi:Aromatic-L-amino-acid decarboxylase protein [Dioscorea alata]|uniref:Aromatic-L-amino-acid decarboxylase protein n=1 Tax=Dioscorea alata TaxID=55571 RepID=A0ACB7UP77_DIOAL|nr:Aromatic-L-amino-acid decarboxylase protein [Dioscorea alata]